MNLKTSSLFLHSLPTMILFGILSFFFHSLLHATPLRSSSHVAYYGEKFYEQYLPKQSANRSIPLAKYLNHILNSSHLERKGHYDELQDDCGLNERNCYQHRVLDYSAARRVVMTQLDLKYSSRKGYFIKDVYCQLELGEEDFPEGEGPGPDQMPSSTMINIEHTWPQSRFTRLARYPQLMQKSDLHHLYPVQSKVNSFRSNNPFGEVKFPLNQTLCPVIKLGKLDKTSSKKYFEPSPPHKGNVARALFYFAVKYEVSITPQEEQFLKRWHKEDPVNEEEQERHEKIFEIQGTRNPFIDHPELVDMITDF